MTRRSSFAAALLAAVLALSSNTAPASMESEPLSAAPASTDSAVSELAALLSDPGAISRISSVYAESLAHRLDDCGRYDQAQSLRRIVISRDSMLASRSAENQLAALSADPESIAAGLVGTPGERILLALAPSARGRIGDYLKSKAAGLVKSGLKETHARLTAVVTAVLTLGSPELRLAFLNAHCHSSDPAFADTASALRDARNHELAFLREHGIGETVISSDFAVVRMGTVLGAAPDGRLRIQLAAELPLGGEVQRSDAVVTEDANKWRLFVR